MFFEFVNHFMWTVHMIDLRTLASCLIRFAYRHFNLSHNQQSHLVSNVTIKQSQPNIDSRYVSFSYKQVYAHAIQIFTN